MALLNLTNTVIILIPQLLSLFPCFLFKPGLFHELYIKISMTAWTVPRTLCYSARPIHPHSFCSLIFYVVLRTSSQEEDTIIITFFQFICVIVTAEIVSEFHIAAKRLFQNVSNGRPLKGLYHVKEPEFHCQEIGCWWFGENLQGMCVFMGAGGSRNVER